MVSSTPGEPDRQDSVMQNDYHKQLRLPHLLLMKIQIAIVALYGSES